MKNITIKRLSGLFIIGFLLTALLTVPTQVYAQSPTLSGPTPVELNDTKVYTVVFPPAGVYVYNWTVVGGTINSETSTQVTVNWTTPGAGSVSINIISATNVYSLSYPVTVNDPVPVYGDENYVWTTAVLEDDVLQESDFASAQSDNLRESISYFDGLGRAIQSVAREESPGGYDIVQPIVYNNFGRQEKSYLPYTVLPGVVSGASDGSLKANPLTDQNSFYDNHFGGTSGDYAFAETEYENWPMDRTLKTYAPGQTWAKASGNKSVTADYRTILDTDKVAMWKIHEGQLMAIGLYTPSTQAAPGTLFKTISTDEDGNQLIDFKRKDGKTVLKRIEAPNSDWADTYYVYDEFGDLRYVIPPETSATINTTNLETPSGYMLVTADADYSSLNLQGATGIAYTPDATVTIDDGVTIATAMHIVMQGYIPTTETINAEVFQYTYDERRRMIEKRVPGSDVVYYVYDERNRLVLTQDGNQRSSNKWTFTKYDQLNRPIITGEKVITGSLSTIRTNVANHTADYETYSAGGLVKYTNNAYPTGVVEAEIHTVTYYDNYDFTSKAFSLPAGIFNSTDTKIIPDDFTGVKGQVTGTLTKILGTTADYVETVNFYDDRYRLIQSKITNHKDGNDVITTQYDFAGRVRKTYLQHNNPSGNVTSTNIAQEYTYDHGSRLLTVTHKINSEPVKTIVSNTYNELGQLIEKDLADGYEDVDYAYNMRGWLTKINDLSDQTDKFFEMDLKYDNATNASYNGNIGGVAWKNPFESMTNTYDYTYDEMNRLTSALYDDGGASAMDFDVPVVSYDLNGNILSLQRRGNHNDTANQLFDNLTYTYANGNQLSKVADASGMDTGFKDGVDETTEYVYDANGNMTEDKNKGITNIDYNYLNLPQKVEFGAKYIEYTYDAAGMKLAQKVVDGGTTKTSDYIGGFVYEDDDLQFVQHDEGRIVHPPAGGGSDWIYQYNLKDHLGNVRATFKTSTDTDNYLADFETASATYESTYFSRYGEVTRINADILNHTSGGDYSIRLNGTGDEVEGLAKSLAVKPGDVIDAEVYVKYIDPSTTGTGAFGALLSSLENNVSTVVTEGATAGTDPLPFPGLVGYGSDVSDGPKAYLNVLVFDQNYDLLSATFEPVTSAAEEDGTDVSHEYVSIDAITIDEPGYVYIYLSNENSTPVEVFFDDFKVWQVNTPIVQKDDFYPFGMSFNSYSNPSATQQNYKYNGKELVADLDLGWYDYQARWYDPALGRWHTVDPAADLMRRHSPYNYAFDNPIRYIDPDGMLPNELGGPEDHDPNSVRSKVANKHNAMSEFGFATPKSKTDKDGNGDSDPKSNGSKVNIELVQSAQATIASGRELINQLGSDGQSSEEGTDPSLQDMALATSGTLFYVGEGLTGRILGSRSGFTSGKLDANSARVYNKQNAKLTNGAFKVLGWAIIGYSIVNTESQFRNGQITLERRQFNHLNNGVGVFAPQFAIPIAAGDYLGQRYSNEIYGATLEPGGFVYEAIKFTLELIGIPTKQE